MSPQAAKRLPAVVAGFVGGLAPFMINLAETLVRSSTLTTKLSLGYFVGILIFGIMGAVMAFVFRETNLKKAFFLGISAPAMISLAVRGQEGSRGTGATEAGPAKTRASLTFVASAYAQEPESTPQGIKGRTLEIQLSGTMPEAVVAFLDAIGHELRAVTIRLHEYDRISVLPRAISIVVRYGDSVTSPYPLSATPDASQYVEVTGTAGREKLDISSAFTGKPKIVYDIKIAELSTTALPHGETGWVYMGIRSKGSWRTRYLDFWTDVPDSATILHPSADLTMRASPSKDGERIGRVKKGESLKVLQFTNTATGAEPGKTDQDGDYYAEVVVQRNGTVFVNQRTDDSQFARLWTVRITDSETVLQIRVKYTGNGAAYKIGVYPPGDERAFFLTAVNGNKVYRLASVEGIAIRPNETLIARGATLDFFLHFARLDDSIDVFSAIEPDKDYGWSFKDIHLDGR